MTSLKKELEAFAVFDRHFKLRECIPLYKNDKNRGKGDQKFDLCLKGCLRTKLSEQRTLLRLSPVTIALCEIFPAKLHMMWFNLMVLGLKVYCPSLF